MPSKLAILVRTDLDMGRGKAAAQAAHAAVDATLRGLGDDRIAGWLREGQPKVVLRVSGAEELDAVATEAGRRGLPVVQIRDAGRTQVAAGTATCCAVGPADSAEVDTVTGHLRLL